jgi:uncharacterized protein with PIN domain
VTGERGGDGNQTFLLDVMLGKLATYLRMCGYDAAYALDRGVEADDRIRELALAEDRTLLTRDEQLAERTPGALLLTEREVDDQLRELAREGVSLSLADPPARCGNCNGPLEPVEGAGPEHAPDGVDCYRCRDCGQSFWQGSHWESVNETLASL